MDRFEEAWKENRHVWESSKNLAKAMYLAGQQSRQAEVDFLSAQLGIKRDQIKSFESEIKKAWQAVEEKDKRIEEVLFVIARAKDGYYGYSNDGGDTDNLVSDLEKALGDNNANP
ncbi:hypothetical protein [Acinetobacter sp. TAC-1]|uniref:hypothetical protein n=1 Tax=Acinetobacter sp. TAC-1 TaxID=3027470 RepID=UPI0023AA2D5A|nr:hypothetical protein [Acinetobacter sp. TAC-1]WEE38599.1 hypothetical protein PYV58_16930 [Acinetobacter sp. TAC-1]